MLKIHKQPKFNNINHPVTPSKNINLKLEKENFKKNLENKSYVLIEFIFY